MGAWTPAVMCVPSTPTDTTLDLTLVWIFSEWLVSLKTSPVGTEGVLEAAAAEEVWGEPGVQGEPGEEAPRADRGCTSSRWRSGRAPWPFTTPTLSNRTASPSTARSSSSERTTPSGSTPRGSPSGHILQCTEFRHGLRGTVQVSLQKSQEFKSLIVVLV